MALIVEGMYAVIASDSGNKRIRNFQVCYYKSKDDYDYAQQVHNLEVRRLKQEWYNCEVSASEAAPNYLIQQYIYLKTTPQFQGAKDA